jgi:hypothetical protein
MPDNYDSLRDHITDLIGFASERRGSRPHPLGPRPYILSEEDRKQVSAAFRAVKEALTPPIGPPGESAAVWSSRVIRAARLAMSFATDTAGGWEYSYEHARTLDAARTALADMTPAQPDRHDHSQDEEVKPPVVLGWSRPTTVTAWAKAFEVSRNTMRKMLKAQTPRNKRVRGLYMLVLDDVPAKERSRHLPAAG